MIKNALFCIRCALFLKKRTSKLYFFSLQSTFARKYWKYFFNKKPNLKAVCLHKNGQFYKASGAILHSLLLAKNFWKILSIFIFATALIFPEKFRDKFYFFMAKRRNCRF